MGTESGGLNEQPNACIQDLCLLHKVMKQWLVLCALSESLFSASSVGNLFSSRPWSNLFQTHSYSSINIKYCLSCRDNVFEKVEKGGSEVE